MVKRHEKLQSLVIPEKKSGGCNSSGYGSQALGISAAFMISYDLCQLLLISAAGDSSNLMEHTRQMSLGHPCGRTRLQVLWPTNNT